MSMKNSSDTIGNRTRDLPTCSAVPQLTALPLGPNKNDDDDDDNNNNNNNNDMQLLLHFKNPLMMSGKRDK
jgi:hypothetical protein